MKTCWTCDKRKDITEFYVRGEGHSNACIACWERSPGVHDDGSTGYRLGPLPTNIKQREREVARRAALVRSERGKDYTGAEIEGEIHGEQTNADCRPKEYHVEFEEEGSDAA